MRMSYWSSDVCSSDLGSYQPEPFLDKTSRIYALALVAGERSPFDPRTELAPAEDESKDDDQDAAKADDNGKDKKKKDRSDERRVGQECVRKCGTWWSRCY